MLTHRSLGTGDPVLQTELRKLAWQDGPTEGL